MGLFVSTVMTEPVRKAKSRLTEICAFCMEGREQGAYQPAKGKETRALGGAEVSDILMDSIENQAGAAE